MIQHFTEPNNSKKPVIEQMGQILYVCDTQPANRVLPRVLHMHQDIMELSFVVRGKGKHLIGKKAYDTKPGDIIVFNSGELHDEMTYSDDILRVFCCGITDLKLKGLEKNHLIGKEVSPIIQSGRHEDEVRLLFELIVKKVKEEQEHSLEAAHYLLISLILLIMELPRENQRDVKELKIVEAAKDYIDEYYMEEINLESISKNLHISASHLSHIFKVETGFSPIQYIIRRRIGQAQTLLINTSYTATQIALMVGYDNTNYFNSLFTKNVGISPQRYRKYWTDSDKSYV